MGTSAEATIYSPGIPPGWTSFENGPAPVAKSDVSALGAFFSPGFFLAPVVSAGFVNRSRAPFPPAAVSVAPGVAPPPIAPLRSRMSWSMRGITFSSAFVLSVIWNCRNADERTRSSARARSFSPGSSTTMRSFPTFCTTGSATPNWSMRLRTTVSARSIASLLFATTACDSSTSSAMYMPPCRSSPRLSGTRRTVVECMTPSVPRLRIVTSRGKSVNAARATRPRMTRIRERMLDIDYSKGSGSGEPRTICG